MGHSVKTGHGRTLMFSEYPWLRGCLGVISCYIADTFKN